MKDFYIENIKKQMDKYEEVFITTIKELFGENLSFEEVELLDIDDQRRIMIKLSSNIKVHDSTLDINKLAHAIQDARSGMGGCAMTNYICKLCGSSEIWTSTAIPGICFNCSESIATNIVLQGRDIFKD